MSGGEGSSSSNGVRQRNLSQVAHGSTEQAEVDSIKKALEIATADPMVRTPAKPAGTTTVDEYWDLDDDENWVDGQTPGQDAGQERSPENLELARRRRVLKRDGLEMGVAFVFHLVVMCTYMYIHVYDATIFKRNKGVGFKGSFTFGGRWKFLTYINLWFQFLFFFLCFFTDIMPWSRAKYWFLRTCDFLFTTVAFPLCMFVVIMFWSIYFVDQELVFPREIEKHIPPILNHLWHTVPLMLVFLELLVVFHRYLSNMISVFAVFVMSTAYIVWIVWVFTNAGIWPYPFFKIIPLPVLPLFFTASFVLTIGFYFLGKWCCYLRWKERHDIMDTMRV